MISVQTNVKGGKITNHEIEVIFNSIKTGGKIKSDILALRELPKSEYSIEKKKIPAILFQGTFNNTRSNETLSKASGFMHLDFDHTGIEFKERLKSVDFIYAAFISVGGDGIKAIVKIPIVKNDKEFKEYWYAVNDKITELFPLYPLDEACKDIARACFFSYDPEIYINYDAKLWVEKKVNETKKIEKEYIKNDYKTVQVALDFVRSSQEGERHNRILKASRLMGGFVASKTISESEAIRLLEQEVSFFNPAAFTSHKQTIKDGIEHGKTQPIEESKKELITEDKHGKIYYTLDDVREKIDLKYELGISRGFWLGYKSLHEFYTIKLKSTTYIFGDPYCGKSQWWFQILVNLSKFYGLKHAIFSPEEGESEDVFILLCQIHMESDFYNDHGNQADKAKLKITQDFIDKHFIILDPGDKLLNVNEFYEYVDIIERKYNIKISTTTIDPWNELLHDFSQYNGRQDLYLDWCLGSIRQNAKARNRHNCIITHTGGTDTRKIIDKDTMKSYYPMPTFRDMAGGQTWSRKGMSIIAVWRPPDYISKEGGECYKHNESVIEILKSKPQGVGKKGVASLYYDGYRHNYYEINEIGNARYAYPQPETFAPSVEKSYSQLGFADINDNPPPF